MPTKTVYLLTGPNSGISPYTDVATNISYYPNGLILSEYGVTIYAPGPYELAYGKYYNASNNNNYITLFDLATSTIKEYLPDSDGNYTGDGVTFITQYNYTATLTSKTGTTLVYDISSSVMPTSISVSSQLGPVSSTFSGRTLTITGLSPNTTYTITMTPNGQPGHIVPYPIKTLSPETTPPGTTSGTTVMSTTTTSVLLNWIAVTGATSYKLYLRNSGGTIINTATTSSTSYTFTGLSGGTFYSALVSAVSAAGEGGAVSFGSILTNLNPPSGIQQVSATTTAINISWNSVVSATSYKIYLNGSASALATVTAPTTNYSITGRTVNTEYTVSVSSLYNGGEGDKSMPVTIRTLANAPTGMPTAVAGDGQATVSWSAVGGTVTNYTVTASPGGASVTTTGTSATVTGLTNGTAYTFTVTANNASGASAPSIASASVTPTGNFTGVTNGVAAYDAVTNSHTITFNMTASSTLPSSASSYTVTRNSVAVSGANLSIPEPNKLKISGLSEYTDYQFNIQITGFDGNATTPSVKTLDRTAPILSISSAAVAPGLDSLTVTWPNVVDGGSAMAKYYILPTSSTPVANALATVTAGASNSYTFTGLNSNTSYTYYVVAEDADGNRSIPAEVSGTTISVASYVATSLSELSASTITRATFKSRMGAMSSQAVALPSASSILALTTESINRLNKTLFKPIILVGSAPSVSAIDVSENSALYIPNAMSLTVGSNTYAITFPTASTISVDGTSYSFGSVVPLDRSYIYAGIGSATLLPVPSAPQSLVATPGDGQIALSWSAPADFGGAASVTYRVDVSGGASATGITGTTYTVTGLTAGQAYTITVRAVNANGLGSPATVSATVLSAVTATVASVTSSSIVYTLSAVGASSLPSSVSVSVGSATLSNSNATLTVSGLSASTLYNSIELNSSGFVNYTLPSATTSAAPGSGSGSGSGSGDPVVPCFFGNAPVLTTSGYRRMDSLRAGDKVLTPAGAEVAIERVKVTRCAASPATNPFVIPKGRFGAESRVLISPNHRVVTDSGLVEACHLGLKQEERQGTLTYYNLELTGQAHMVVGGVAVESLAPVKRMVLTMDQFKAALQQKYGRDVNAAVLANIQRTCRFLADGRVEVPVLRK